jgi:cysteinyl-tRNA synthetase
VGPDEIGWDTRLGRGHPGWHIECSAMSMALLGESFDIHCGGVDNIFPHHENEIAQSEAATGKRFVRIWCHSQHLRVSGEKMAKRAGNFATVREVLDDGASAASLRYLLAARTHYRKPLEYSDELLADSNVAVQRLVDFQTRVAGLPTVEDADNVRDDAVLASVRGMRIGFEEAMDDDLNVPEAMGIVFSGLRDVNRVLDTGAVTAETQRTLRHLLDEIDGVLGVFALVARDRQTAPDAQEQQWLEQRAAARAARDFAQSDQLRIQLASRGIEVEDTPQGQRWKRISPRRG